eukprot:jgi/Mesvir1/1557/Mv14536-RA.1
MDGTHAMEALGARQLARTTSRIFGSGNRVSRALARAAALAGLITCSSLSDASGDTSDRSPVSTHPEGTPLSNYDVTIIRGDGRCLFRAVVVSAAKVMGLRPPSPSEEAEAADLLRKQVVAEFQKRREEVEWFIEGDFDSYLRYMSQPTVWGGEPELLMLSHVLRWPIKVFIPTRGQEYTHVTAIGTYGEEYATNGKDPSIVKDPILLWYDGVGHYNALAERSKSR